MIYGSENVNSTKNQIAKKMKKYCFLTTSIYFCLSIIILISSCKDDKLEKLKPKTQNLVSKKIFNATYTFKDSGYKKIELRSPLVEIYEEIDTPYTLFRKGLNLNFYQTGKPNPGYLRASYAKIIELKGLYEAKGNVIVINPDGDTLKTQSIYWNKITKLINTKDTVKIYRKDKSYVIANHGLTATEDFKTFTLYQNRGAAMVKQQ